MHNGSIEESLKNLTKKELTEIRRRFEIPGISHLNKKELRRAIGEKLPEYLDCWLHKTPALVYDFIEILLEEGQISKEDYSDMKHIYENLSRLGLVCEGTFDGKIYMMPERIRKKFKKIVDSDLKQQMEKNSHFIHSLGARLYFYGMLDYGKIYDLMREQFDRKDSVGHGEGVLKEYLNFFDDMREAQIEDTKYLYHRSIDDNRGVIIDSPQDLLALRRENLNFKPLTDRELKYYVDERDFPWESARKLRDEFLQENLESDFQIKINMDRLFQLFNLGQDADMLRDGLIIFLADSDNDGAVDIDEDRLGLLMQEFTREAHCWVLKGHSMASQNESWQTFSFSDEVQPGTGWDINFTEDENLEEMEDDWDESLQDFFRNLEEDIESGEVDHLFSELFELNLTPATEQRGDFSKRIRREIQPDWNLGEFLQALTKDELTRIRRNLEISGISNLKKSKLVEALNWHILKAVEDLIDGLNHSLQEHLEDILFQGGIVNLSERGENYSLENPANMMVYKYLQERGLAFIGEYQGDIIQVMPTRVRSRVEAFLDESTKEIGRQNSDLLQLTVGHLVYYGLCKRETLCNIIFDSYDLEERYGRRIEKQDYFAVMDEAIEYLFQMDGYLLEKEHWSGLEEEYYALSNLIFPEVVLSHHRDREELSYYIPSEDNVYFAAENYLPIEAAEQDINEFLQKSHLRTNKTAANAEEITISEDELGINRYIYYMINNDYNQQFIINGLEEIISGMKEGDFLELVEILQDFNNSIPHWALKGRTPDDVQNML